MSKKNNSMQYAGLIAAAITDMFNEDSDFYIDQEELGEGDNLTDFFHALANAVPNVLYNEITGDSKNNLEFNHLANTLCVQYMNIPDKENNPS